MTEQISLLAVYDKVAALDSTVKSLVARVEERLDHGGIQLADHETRLRSLETSRDQGRGKTGALTVLLSIGGSSTAAAVISYLLTRH